MFENPCFFTANWYLPIANQRFTSLIYIMVFKQSYTIAESTGGNAFVAPRGTIAAGTDACTASTQS